MKALRKKKQWKKQWKGRINYSNNSGDSLKLMQIQNPLVIPRNHLVELALENCKEGNYNEYNDLIDLISNPYNYKSNYEFQTTPEGYDDSYKTFCGT